MNANSPESGVAERGQVADVGVLADEAGERGEQRRQQQPRHPAVEAVGHARVVGLHEVEVDRRLDRGQDETRQHLAGEVHDVGVLEGEVRGALLGEHVADREPARAALARLTGVEPGRGHLLDERLDGRRLVPQDDLAPRVALEVRDRAVVVVERRVVEREHERVEVAHAAELVEDAGERGPVHLGGHERDHERDGEAGGERLEAPLHLVDVAAGEERESRHWPELVEVAHAAPPRQGADRG